jgi:predicted porin
MKRIFLSLLTLLFLSLSITAQDDLLDELDQETQQGTSFELPAFKAMKIANLQSTKVAEKGDLYLYVSHRFGTLQDGIETFFGLDNANTKIQLVYGFWEGVQLGIGRESLRQTYSSHIKVRLAKQSNKNPFNFVFYGTANIDTELDDTRFPELKFGDRMSYATQLLISRRFSEKFSFLVAPSYIRQNLQDLNLTGANNHNQFALGLGGRYKLSKRMSFNADYAYNFKRDSNSLFNNPLTIGVDIETGGHVFQLLFSNAQSTNEPGFLSNAEGDWGDGNVFFGFNIVRVF